jgi:hypothetical protein
VAIAFAMVPHPMNPTETDSESLDDSDKVLASFDKR